MPDTIFPPVAGEASGIADTPVVAAPSTEQSEAAQERVQHLTERFIYAWTHPRWQRWRREAEEDWRFVSGVGHWPDDLRARLEEQQRVILSLNQIRPVIEVLTGYERASRLESRPIPEGPEDLEAVTLLGKLLKRVQYDLEVDWVHSECFKNGVVTGFGCLYVGIDYGDDPVHGKPDLELCEQFEVVCDPDFRRYDAQDAREWFRHRMVAIDELIARWPEHEAAIRQAVEEGPDAPGRPARAVVHYDVRDPYKAKPTETGEGTLTFYDAKREEVRVLDAWYRDWETQWVLADKRENRVTELPEDPMVLEAARALAKYDDKVRLVKHKRRIIKESVILPALGLELEYGNPFENDEQTYPYIPFWAYRELDEILGIVRNLKDPQREHNKRRSAMADNVARYGAIRWLATKDDLEDPLALESGQGAGFVIWQKKNAKGKPEQLTPPTMPQWVFQLAEVAKMDMREISGINADLLGMRDTDASGIAIARRQQQGQIISTSLFDNYKLTRKLASKRLCKRIQQVYSAERTIRLDPGAAEHEFVTLNQRVIRDGREVILNNVPDLKYDVIMADTPATPSARQFALNALLEIAQRVPQIAPALADIMIELTDIPNRDQVLARVRQIMGMTAPGPGGAAGGGPPGNGRPALAGPGGRPTPPVGSPGPPGQPAWTELGATPSPGRVETALATGGY